jgi:hypothetical protein
MAGIIRNPNQDPPNIPTCFLPFVLGILVAIFLATLCCAMCGCGAVLTRNRVCDRRKQNVGRASARYVDEESEPSSNDLTLTYHVSSRLESLAGTSEGSVDVEPSDCEMSRARV